MVMLYVDAADMGYLDGFGNRHAVMRMVAEHRKIQRQFHYESTEMKLSEHLKANLENIKEGFKRENLKGERWTEV